MQKRTSTPAPAFRLTIYLGEDKQNVDQPLFKSIVEEARLMHMAGATVVHGAAGYGRSARLHTSEVLFSTDLPIVILIVDIEPRIEALIARLANRSDIGLITCEPVEVRGQRQLDD